MNFYMKNGAVFVRIGEGYMMCIGTKSEFDRADEGKLAEMISQATAFSRFKTIEHTSPRIH